MCIYNQISFGSELLHLPSVCFDANVNKKVMYNETYMSLSLLNVFIYITRTNI